LAAETAGPAQLQSPDRRPNPDQIIEDLLDPKQVPAIPKIHKSDSTERNALNPNLTKQTGQCIFDL
jgi:hypothetical protein